MHCSAPVQFFLNQILFCYSWVCWNIFKNSQHGHECRQLRNQLLGEPPPPRSPTRTTLPLVRARKEITGSEDNLRNIQSHPAIPDCAQPDIPLSRIKPLAVSDCHTIWPVEPENGRFRIRMVLQDITPQSQ